MVYARGEAYEVKPPVISVDTCGNIARRRKHLWGVICKRSACQISASLIMYRYLNDIRVYIARHAQ